MQEITGSNTRNICQQEPTNSPSELDDETPPLAVQTVAQETPELPALDQNNLYVTISKKKLSQLENDTKIGKRIKAKLTQKNHVNSTWSPFPRDCYDACPKAGTQIHRENNSTFHLLVPC